MSAWLGHISVLNPHIQTDESVGRSENVVRAAETHSQGNSFISIVLYALAAHTGMRMCVWCARVCVSRRSRALCRLGLLLAGERDPIWSQTLARPQFLDREHYMRLTPPIQYTGNQPIRNPSRMFAGSQHFLTAEAMVKIVGVAFQNDPLPTNIE